MKINKQIQHKAYLKVRHVAILFEMFEVAMIMLGQKHFNGNQSVKQG